MMHSASCGALVIFLDYERQLEAILLFHE